MTIKVYTLLSLALNAANDITKVCRLCKKRKSILHFPLKDREMSNKTDIKHHYKRICYECYDAFIDVELWSKCPICGKIDTIESFCKVKKGGKKYASYCRSCNSKRAKEYNNKYKQITLEKGVSFKLTYAFSALRLLVNILNEIKNNPMSRINTNETINRLFKLKYSYGSMYVYKLTQLGILIRYTHKDNIRVYDEYTINPVYQRTVDKWISKVYNPNKKVFTPRSRIDDYIDLLDKITIKSIDDFIDNL